MIPLQEYATVDLSATLIEAVLALEEAQNTLGPTQHKHRAILVLDENGKAVSKITMKEILVALEPSTKNMEGAGVLERSGYSPDLIKSMLEDKTLWMEPLQFFRERASELKVGDFIQPPAEDEYIDANATLGEATRQLVVFPFHSLIVTSDDEVVGILRLSDLFSKICDIIKVA